MEREFSNGLYEEIENTIIPEDKKQRFVMRLMGYNLLFIVIGLIIVSVIFQGGSFTIDDPIMLMVGFLGYVVGYILFILIHEWLHGISFRIFGNVPKNQIKFGVVWKSGMAFCISLVPVKVKAARISLMMPLYAFCIPLFIISIILNNYILACYTVLLASGSVGDLYYLWKLRKTDKELYMYEEMPTKTGYQIGYRLYKKIEE